MFWNRTRLLLCAVLVVAIVAAFGVGTTVAIAAPASFTITGHVADTTGHSVENAHVIVYRDTEPTNPWFAAEDAYTNAAGNYTVTYPTGYWTNNGPGDPGYAGSYAVLFWPPGVDTNDEYYRPQWWNAAQGYWAQSDIWQWDWQAAHVAQDFVVPAAGVTKANVDAVLERYQGVIVCTVRDSHSGLPIPGVAVTLYHFDTVTVSDAPYLEDTLYTDSNGRCTYSADPTLAVGSWWTVLLEKPWYAKAWLGGTAYQPATVEASQAALPSVTHFQVASEQTATVSATLVPLQLPLAITRSPSSSSVSYKRKKGVAKFSLSATLSDARGAVRGAVIWLQKSTNGSKWSNLYQLTTSASGKASKAFSAKKSGTTYYRWSAGATPLDRAGATPKQKVTVK